MLAALLPFLMSANDAGVISLCIFLAATVIFTIPVFATRGSEQMKWAGIAGFALFLLGALLVTWVVLLSTGEISSSIS
jgi:hypothetical protein